MPEMFEIIVYKDVPQALKRGETYMVTPYTKEEAAEKFPRGGTVRLRIQVIEDQEK
jgi:hypothetical protein